MTHEPRIYTAHTGKLPSSKPASATTPSASSSAAGLGSGPFVAQR